MTTPAAIEMITPGQDQRLPEPPAHSEAERKSRSRAGRRVLVIGVLAIVIIGGAFLAGTLPRLQQQHEVNAAAAKASAAPPRVTVVTVRSAAPNAARVLPGYSLPLLDAAIYARTTGYLKRRLVDIGDRVEEGHLLAEISAPDVDAQLAQAQADLAQAKANLPLAEANAELAKSTLKRYVDAGPGTGVTLLQIDQQRSTIKTTAAQVEATKASIQVYEAAVQRYTVLQGFQKIVAPFPGVITARNVDPGDLITADSPSTSKQLFHLMRTDTLRVFVNVPQIFATGIKVGQDAVVYLQLQPQTQYPGKVTRTANALDPSSRTLLTEVDVPNPKDALRPGMYLQVKFVFDRQILTIQIPSAALVVTSSGGQQVAVLDEQHRVHYRTVQLGRDFGAEIEVIGGLKVGETVVVHPGDALPEGTVVEPVDLTAAKPGS